ncbi:hypothetical protein [Synoicihabitans lomoniglobus]|uniref:Uncharacterized protein n=1 Tax=Synoicihabitans lomoniglobus TaxID=2909285 RepID=A0AAE9ZR13_9BACT|nr:hypothetical protein [Opitutaceae bacterium LMO-M01]WED63600.1 hypothetical protein PXH66_14785 [Opitutaceae bacterium LMO-M01]
MSLNRGEQMLCDYVSSHPEEQRFWVEKVRATAASEPDEHQAAADLTEELWRYYEERSAVASPFRELAGREGLRRISMRNLAEYWLRLWVEPRPKKKRPDAGAW